jgi:hypothetical protein
MTGFKSLRPGWSGRRLGPSEFAGTVRKARAEMQTDAPSPRAAGRLSREDQRRLGDILQRVYDEVIQQGIPDRFKDLLNELDNAGDPAANEAASDPDRSAHGRDGGENGQASDRLLGANGLDSPPGKGQLR